MTIDGWHFAPGWSALGGALIGVAVALFMIVHGRILGISGIVGGLLNLQRGDKAWRVAVLAGMAAAPWTFMAWAPSGWLHAPRIDASWWQIVVAGLLVGVGTRMGGGCTSGHGICGLARLSPRSVVATLVFMAAGFAVVFVMRHGWAG